jgi:ABC-2 type transport system ATP-binding protein
VTPDPRDPAIVTEALRKRYGQTHALRGLDLQVPAGGVFGLLGPNGAGKTTLVRILSTLTLPDSGRATVAGHDVVRQPRLVRKSIGLAGQYAAVDERLTGRENLVMFGRLFRLSGRQARRHADELLERYHLSYAANRVVATYSGGMRRRLDLVSSLLVAPAVLFLDEPTTGLDPRSRNEIWEAVGALAGAGTTVVLTTQYLDEADRLAASIAVVDGGRVIASGTCEELKATIGTRLDVVVRDAALMPAAAAVLGTVSGTEPATDPEERRISVPIPATASVDITDLLRDLDTHGVAAEDIALRQPTLDEVFLRLTQNAPADHLATDMTR